MPKKKTPTQMRTAKGNPGLKKELHPRTRWEYLDADYMDKLSPEEKEFYSKFNEEYYGASLAKEDEPKKWKKDLHKTPELRKECRDRNNARNRDLYSISRTKGWVESIKDNEDALDDRRILQHDLDERVIIKEIDEKTKKASSK